MADGSKHDCDAAGRVARSLQGRATVRRPTLRKGKTIWLKRPHSVEVTRFPTLRGHHDTSVAIVGGGMTGAMIAEAFANHGSPVIVVDAARPGHGSTAASTALLLQEPDEDVGALTARYGAATARRIWRISRRATDEFKATIRRLRISCGLLDRDSIYYTLNEAQIPELKREWRRRQDAGLGGRWLDARALEQVTGIAGAGAIRTSGNAQLNPLLAAAGLLDAAVRHGAAVFERSPVNRIRRAGGKMRIYTPHGTIDAALVIIATGYATRYFRPLAGRFKMRHTYVLATNRISERQRRQLGLGAVMLWDAERPYHYVRWTPDRRLLVGGEDRPVTPGANRAAQFAAATSELRDYFEAHLPVLREVGFDTAWEGLFAMTPDGLPYIGPHRRYPGHTFALGYGGNGMTFAALAARVLLEQWRGLDSADHRLFAFTRPPSRR
jgi:glycine/D-amino acid oxidase-like deaminating enzyme